MTRTMYRAFIDTRVSTFARSTMGNKREAIRFCVRNVKRLYKQYKANPEARPRPEGARLIKGEVRRLEDERTDRWRLVFQMRIDSKTGRMVIEEL